MQLAKVDGRGELILWWDAGKMPHDLQIRLAPENGAEDIGVLSNRRSVELGVASSRALRRPR